MKQKIFLLLVLAGVLGSFLFLNCYNDNESNPFTNPENADVIIDTMSSTVRDNDTIPIFSTQTIYLTLLLPDYIDSLTMHIPKNRLAGTDDSVIHKSEISSTKPGIKFSFYDTGSLSLSFSVHRTDGKISSKTIRLFAQSPLSQKSITGKVGDTVVLETAPVEDVVLYNWDLKNGEIIREQTAKKTCLLLKPLVDGFGELYVSDAAHRSPPVRFTMSSTEKPGSISFTKEASVIKESVPTALVGIALSSASTDSIKIRIVVDTVTSTASKSDCSLVDSIITFKPGEVLKSVVVAIIDDKIVELAETVVLNCTVLSGNATVNQAMKKHVITIQNNDFLLSIGVYPANSGSIVRKVNNVVDTGPYDAGTAVEITASAESGYRFGYFGGAKNSTINPIVMVIDTVAQGVTAVFIPTNAPTPGVLQEVWMNIQGDTIGALTANSLYPDKPTKTGVVVPYFETDSNSADNYGQRLRAFIFPPQTGTYTFWISSDNQSQLFVGSSDAASSAVKIASVPSFTGRREWNKFPSQQSTVITLTEGNRYYIEALHKESVDADHLSVGWKLVDGTEEMPIPSYRLTPYVSPNAPVITSQPQAQTVKAGETARFTIGATGTPPLSYQWYKDTIAMQGATDASYTTPATTPADNNTQFKCVVKNNAGPVTSNVASLTVNYLPVITEQPKSQSVNVNQAVSFSVVALGNPAPAYQWEKNGIPISGQVSNIFAISSPTLADSGTYTVVVTNLVGTVRSNPAILTVTPFGWPTIISQSQSQTVNEGQSVTFTVVATGIPSPTYQWKKNGVVLVQATSNEFSIIAATISDSGSYSVTVANTVGSVTSAAMYLTVKALLKPLITQQPKDSQTVKEGLKVSLSVMAIGNPLPRYQWFKNGSVLAHETLNVYSIPSILMKDSGSYTVDVYNFLDTVTSLPALLRVVAKPVITKQPASLALKTGQPAVFSVAATGNPALSYQWQKNGSAIAGEITETFKIASASMNDTGKFTVVVSNSEGTVVSDTALLAVNSKPVITTEPKDSQTVKAGSLVKLSVQAVGFPLPLFQWRKNGQVMTNETSGILTFSAVSLSDSGYYSVIVSNSEGSDTSISAHIMVVAKPYIAQQPKSVTVRIGQSALCTVVAVGNPPPTYQWKKNGQSIDGQTSAMLSIPLVSVSDTGVYTVQVSNSQGDTVSEAVFIRLYAKPVITTQPVDSLVVKVGQTAVGFSAVASGNPSPLYQWRKNNGALPNQTSSVITFPSVTANDSGTYKVVAYNSEGADTSEPVRLVVLVKPAITTQPLYQRVKSGESAQFYVVAGGNPMPTYQWRKNGSLIPGKVSSTFSIPTVSPVDTGMYSVLVSNSEGSVLSDEVRLDVLFKPIITTQPKDSQTVKAGQSVTLSVLANGNPAVINYQWKKGTVVLENKISNTLTISPIVLTDSGFYTVAVSNSQGTEVSSQAHIMVIEIPSITKQPLSHAVKIGDTAQFSVEATGTPAPTYQWLKNGSVISSANGKIYSTGPVIADDTMAPGFSVVVSNQAGSITSAAAKLSIVSKPIITTEPRDTQIIMQGKKKLSITVAATGSPLLKFRWYKNGILRPKDTLSVLTIDSTILADSGYYYVIVENMVGSDTSVTAHVTVESKPIISRFPESVTVALNATAVFTVEAYGNPSVAYQWSKDYVEIPGETSSTLRIPNVINQGFYSVVVSNDHGTADASAILTISKIKIVK